MPDENRDATSITTRRTLLAELGAAGMAGLAGCGGSGDGGDGATPTATETGTATDSGGDGALGVAVDDPESVGATSATLAGDLGGLGGADAATVGFEYRREGASEWTASATQSRTEPGAFAVDVSDLRPDTDYEFRAVASSGAGDSDVSGTDSFSTDRAIWLGDVTVESATSLTVTGDVAPDVGGAELRVEYRTLLADDWAESESSTVESGVETVERTLSGLTSRSIYEVQLHLALDDYETTTVSLSVTTPNDGDAADDSSYETAAAHHPGDGFADFGAWVDDDTPVLRVTELTREKLQTALELDRPRLIVFETGGTLDLGGESLAIENDKCWLAGQTAPSPGVTLVRGGIFVDAADVVIQHVRVRRGDDTPESGAGDAIGTSENPENCVFDHVTATWGTDETLSCYGTDMTISNSIVAEALRNSEFHQGGNGHSAGSLIGSGYERIAMLGNLWASNLTRNPRIQSGTSVVVNNVSYDFRNGVGCSSETTSSVVANAYLRGDVNSTAIYDMDPHSGEMYADGNYTRPQHDVVSDGLNLVDSRPVWPDGLSAIDPERTESQVFQNAGARPADRTYHDRRVVHNAANWTAIGDERPGDSGLDHAWIDHQEAVGGYPALESTSHALEVPDDGTRAWLGDHARRVEEHPEDDYQYARDAGVVDDFEDGDLAEWVGALEEYAVTDEPPVAAGEYSLKNVTGDEGVVASFTDLPRYPQAGDTVTAKVAPTEETDVVGIAFGIKSFENYYFVRYWPESSALQLFKVTDDEGSDPTREKLAQSGGGSLTTGDVYEFVLDWGADGSIDVDLRDDAGETVMSLSATDTTHRWGGFGTRRSGMLDDVRIS